MIPKLCQQTKVAPFLFQHTLRHTHQSHNPLKPAKKIPSPNLWSPRENSVLQSREQLLKRDFQRSYTSSSTSLYEQVEQIPSIFEVPKGMSCVNVLFALWLRTHPISDSNLKNATESFSPKQIANIFKERTFIYDIAGSPILTNFFKFPTIDARLLDKYLREQGAALKAIQEYAKIPPKERFDAFDSYVFKKLTNGIDL